MTAILRRELRSYFTGLSAYVFAAFLLVFAGIYTMAINLSGMPNFEYTLANMSFIFLVAIPILTMRCIAEEKRQKTDALLYSLPISMTKIILGKFFALAVIIAIPTLIMGTYPLILSAYGNMNFAAAYGTLLAFYLLALTLASIGMFVSSLTENQATAAGICFAAMLLIYFLSALTSFLPSDALSSLIAFDVLALLLCVVVYLLTKSGIASFIFGAVSLGVITVSYFLQTEKFEGLFAKAVDTLSVYERFDAFVYGQFDITAVVYFISVIAVFIFLSVQSMEKRRWN